MQPHAEDLRSYVSSIILCAVDEVFSLVDEAQRCIRQLASDPQPTNAYSVNPPDRVYVDSENLRSLDEKLVEAVQRYQVRAPSVRPCSTSYRYTYSASRSSRALTQSRANCGHRTSSCASRMRKKYVRVLLRRVCIRVVVALTVLNLQESWKNF